MSQSSPRDIEDELEALSLHVAYNVVMNYMPGRKHS